jgi:hypothetical protein
VLQLTHDEIELTNNDIQDMLLDMGFNEYRATQIQGDFFSSLAECGQKFGNVVSEAAIKEIMIASIVTIMLELSTEELEIVESAASVNADETG